MKLSKTINSDMHAKFFSLFQLFGSKRSQ